MKIFIQRPWQIGGQITKISTNKANIIIDLGHNLPNTSGDKDPLDNREAIEKLTKGCDAVLYTHYHSDHIGLCKHVPETVPQYISTLSKEVMLCKDKWIMKWHEDLKQEYGSVQCMRTYEANKPMEFADIKVTPYFVSHSAGYAHMFLIEVNGKRILHTGDFRGHGLLSNGLMPTMKSYIRNVDVLITEGTMLGRNERVLSEHRLGKIARKYMEKYKYVFVQCSSTDLERLAVISDATKSLRHHLVCDGYQAEILSIFAKVKHNGEKVWDFGEVRVFSDKNEDLIEDMLKEGFTMFVRASQPQIKTIKRILPKLDPKHTLFIYSLWEGYINRSETLNEKFVELQANFKNSKFLAPILNLHTSGHATMDTLRKVCETLKPSTAIIPIHRDETSNFNAIGIDPELQEKVVTNDCTLNGIDISFC